MKAIEYASKWHSKWASCVCIMHVMWRIWKNNGCRCDFDKLVWIKFSFGKGSHAKLKHTTPNTSYITDSWWPWIKPFPISLRSQFYNHHNLIPYERNFAIIRQANIHFWHVHCIRTLFGLLFTQIAVHRQPLFGHFHNTAESKTSENHGYIIDVIISKFTTTLRSSRRKTNTNLNMRCINNGSVRVLTNICILCTKIHW